MANKEVTTLKTLSREFAPAMRELLEEKNDRAAVLMGASLVDNLVGAILRHVLLGKDDDPDDELLKPDRPLGSFSARNKLVHRLGWITREMFDDLETIRGIRNDCAHTHATVSLNQQSFRDRCRNLKTFESTLPMVASHPGFSAVLDKPRERFIYTVLALCLKLVVCMNRLPPATKLQDSDMPSDVLDFVKSSIKDSLREVGYSLE